MSIPKNMCLYKHSMAEEAWRERERERGSYLYTNKRELTTEKTMCIVGTYTRVALNTCEMNDDGEDAECNEQ